MQAECTFNLYPMHALKEKTFYFKKKIKDSGSVAWPASGQVRDLGELPS